MARQAFVSTSYRGATPAKRTDLGDKLIIGFTDNSTTFNALPMTVNAFRLINNTYKSLTTLAESGDQTAKDNRDTHYTDNWLPAVDEYQVYVNSVAAGIAATVRLSGFTSTTVVPVASVIPAQLAADVTAGAANSRTLNTNSKTRVKAKAFATFFTEADTIELSQDDNLFTITFNDAQGNPLASAKVLFDTGKKGSTGGFARGKKMNVAMTGINSAGCGTLSNSVNIIVP